MPDCDYCSDSFDGEDAYLDHLAADHADEVGFIDQRRIDNRTSDDGGLPLGLLAVGVVAAIVIGGGFYAVVLSGGVSPDGIEAAALDQRGDADRLSAVESFESQGTQHVEAGSEIDYAQTPPLSGPHYNTPTTGGYYESTQSAGNLVHALEHGAVVIYYDPAAEGGTAGDDETPTESLREFAATHTNQWGSVIVVPNPADEPQADYVLTAWQHRLTMDDYDPETVHAFLSEYLGRGPENPIR